MKATKKIYGIALALTGSWAATLNAQNLFVDQAASGTIGEYGLGGQTVNASLISGLNGPDGIAFLGNDLFVANSGSGTIGEYTSSGATVNASLISGLNNPYDVAIFGNNIFVASGSIYGGWSVSEYTTSGAVVNGDLVANMYFPGGLAASGNGVFAIPNTPVGTVDFYTPASGTTQLISGLTRPFGVEPMNMVVSGSDLFISLVNDSGNGIVGEYTTSGSTINAALISESQGPSGIAILGNDLFMVNSLNGTVSEYTTSGALVSASLITGLGITGYIALGPAPEPSNGLLTGVSAVALLLWRRWYAEKVSPKSLPAE